MTPAGAAPAADADPGAADPGGMPDPAGPRAGLRHRQGRHRQDHGGRRLAQLAADQGRRVLACEVDAKGDLASLFEAGPTDFTEHEISPGVFAMSMDTEASLREYLRLNLKIPVVGRIGPLSLVGFGLDGFERFGNQHLQDFARRICTSPSNTSPVKPSTEMGSPALSTFPLTVNVPAV